ncbi:MAG: hypothetical protein WKG07_30315 [Hymenobacter sp.]
MVVVDDQPDGQPGPVDEVEVLTLSAPAYPAPPPLYQSALMTVVRVSPTQPLQRLP